MVSLECIYKTFEISNTTGLQIQWASKNTFFYSYELKLYQEYTMS